MTMGDSDAAADQINFLQPGAARDIAVQVVSLEVQPDEQGVYGGKGDVVPKAALQRIVNGTDNLQFVAQNISGAENEKGENPVDDREEPARFQGRTFR